MRVRVWKGCERPLFIPFNSRAGYVRSIGYIWAWDRTCLVKSGIELPGQKRSDMSGKESGHVRSIQDKTYLEVSRNSKMKDSAYSPIVVHILVIYE
jgi:hypothetical protein